MSPAATKKTQKKQRTYQTSPYKIYFSTPFQIAQLFFATAQTITSFSVMQKITVYYRGITNS